ncbi:MAG TPA: sugar transferase [Dermatophilaceae bacterium]|nr:sugar transferase [Dermatophilaceae bacterium]
MWAATGITAGAGRAEALYRFRSKVAVSDLVVVTLAVIGAHLIRFGPANPVAEGGVGGAFQATYVLFSALLVLGWLAALRLHGAYRVNTLGRGTEEYRSVAAATLRLFATVAVVSYAAQLQIARGYVIIALPAGLGGLLLTRRASRAWLGRRRAEGEFCHDVLVVGDSEHLRSLVDNLRSAPAAGYRVVAACSADADTDVAGVPVLGSERDAGDVARRLAVDTVVCASSRYLGPSALRQLGWELEGSGTELVVAPGLLDVAGPRLTTRPVAGLPLLHVEAPMFSGPKLFVKTALDVVGAGVLLLLASPLLLAVLLVIWAGDRGPVFFLQERVGLDGRRFRMVKFRSMVVDAESRLASLRSGQGVGSGDADGPLFKLRHDPRVTPVGRFIRRHSIDELPQLFNVVAGQMSLVGPRPPLPGEVEQYGDDVRRRLLVKPGMTGLWQINGRSDLSWEQSVRLDLYYVENWSVLGDLTILWRTIRTVLNGHSGY